MEVVAAALRRHPSDPGVQWRGLGAQAVFAATGGTGLPETLRRQRESGVADLVRILAVVSLSFSGAGSARCYLSPGAHAGMEQCCH